MAAEEGEKQQLEEEEDQSGVKNRALKLAEAVDILKNYKGNVSQSRAIKPKAGEIYLFDTNLVGDDWKCDNYMWRNSGTIYQPKSNPVVKKSFNSIRLDESKREGSKVFQKTLYSLLVRPNIVMVHYSGDETVYYPLKHGNRKRGYQEYQRTVPSVMNSIKKAISETPRSTPKNTLKHLTMTHQLEELPRDLDQIRNVKRLMTKKNEIIITPKSSRNPKKIETQMMPELQRAVTEVIMFEQQHSQGEGTHLVPAQHPDPPSSPEHTEVSYMEGQESLYVATASGIPETTVSAIVTEDNIVVLDSDQVEEIQSEEIEEVVEDEAAPEAPVSIAMSTPALAVAHEPTEEPDHEEPDQESFQQPEQPLFQSPTQKTTLIPAPGTSSAIVNEAEDATGISPLKEALLNKVTKDQTIILQALDPRPEVCQVQLEILNLQKRNLELQEAKLMLEIRKLQHGEIKQEKEGEETFTSSVEVPQSVVDAAIEVPEVVDEQNIIYIQDPGMVVDNDGQQVIYIEDPSAFTGGAYTTQEYSNS